MIRPRVLLVLAMGLGIATRAAAQDGEPSRVAAEAYGRGYALQQEGKYADALKVYEGAAWATPSTKLREAECHAQLGHLIEAERIYRSLLTTPSAPKAVYWMSPEGAVMTAPAPATAPSPETPEQIVARDDATRNLALLSARTPKLRVLVQRWWAASELQMTVDGVRFESAYIDKLVEVDPGTHEVVVSAKESRPYVASVTVGEGETTTVSVKLASGAYADDSKPATPGASWTAWGVPLIVAGGVALVVGVVAAVAASHVKCCSVGQ
jgi:hypothetical protein